METTLNRSADIPLPQQAHGLMSKIGRLLIAVATSVGERVTSPPKDVPPEFFRFPLP
jgi:hypothetical protein